MFKFDFDSEPPTVEAKVDLYTIGLFLLMLFVAVSCLIAGVAIGLYAIPKENIKQPPPDPISTPSTTTSTSTLKTTSLTTTLKPTTAEGVVMSAMPTAMRTRKTLPDCTAELVENKVACKYSQEGVGKICYPSGEGCGSWACAGA